MLASFAILVSALAVTQTPRATSLEVYATSSATSALQSDRRDAIRTFLADRARDAFGIEAGDTPAIAEGVGRPYAVSLRFDGAQVLVEVSREGDLLASRTLPLDDNAEASVWMLVSSAIERDLTESPVFTQTATTTATIAPIAATVPENTNSSTVRANTISTPAPLKLFGMEDIESISGTLFTETSVQGGFSFGPAATVAVELKEGYILGASFAYRSSSPTDGLELRRVPLALRVGYIPVKTFDVEAGLSLGIDVGTARASSVTNALFGLNAGPYIRGRIPFAQWEGSEISAAGELGVTLALLRGEYYFRGESYDDGVFSARLLAGLEWRWR